jgi:hypothetical protein
MIRVKVKTEIKNAPRFKDLDIGEAFIAENTSDLFVKVSNKTGCSNVMYLGNEVTDAAPGLTSLGPNTLVERVDLEITATLQDK